MPKAKPDDRVMLIAPDEKRYMLQLKPGHSFHTNLGIVRHDDILGGDYGRTLESHLGNPFVVLNTSIHDKLMRLKRKSQIIYPKEIGQILLKLDAGSGKRIIEAGTGSGALTMALANAVRPEGHVYSYERREDMQTNAQRNLRLAGLDEHVTFVQGDIAEGFQHDDADALFLDVREPWLYMDQVRASLADGGFFGALVPTTNQVSELIYTLERSHFVMIEVQEIFVRYYKPVPARLRPQDTMVGHTGFLIFARKVRKPEPPTDGTGSDMASSQKE